ncbi:hypothetical protein K431DRAFT_271258 [Polychaeton citri CBS 116435]|uniref:Trichothecene 3-O-acetyltransferase-like N-terminal domain-containing protein n=1 Tax=Polychaeton citri CBS 116435 TaxID=1314669 RepID=A0A9P4Q8W3_9PEZI|nr:hypothetical protein K431DRAFT_271258 [Polychaeton citri CBS 116435]
MLDQSTLLLNETLDIFGQNPRLSRLYTQLCFAFPLPNYDIQLQARITAHLSHGLEILAAALPWVAGEVIRDDTGLYRIRACGSTPTLAIKDLSNQLPSFEEYRKARFPFKILDEMVIAPRRTLPDAVNENAPVFLLQVNFVVGGLLLVFNGQHNCMDFRGQAEIIRLFSKACREEVLTDGELEAARLPRFDWIQTIGETENLPRSKTKSILSAAASGEQAPRLSSRNLWTYFLFSSDALSTLKSTAVETMESEYVSTDDVLSAFIWQAVLRARKSRLESMQVDSVFERQVDARKRLGIPEGYTGNVVFKSKSVLHLQYIIEAPLGVVASRLRQALNPTPSIEHQVREAATTLHKEIRESGTISGSIHTGLPLTGIRLSSWAKENCYGLDFGGLLGKAEAIRRPSFKTWEGLVYFLPKALNGEIAVALCLRDDDLERLRSDDLFRQYGQYVG